MIFRIDQLCAVLALLTTGVTANELKSFGSQEIRKAIPDNLRVKVNHSGEKVGQERQPSVDEKAAMLSSRGEPAVMRQVMKQRGDAIRAMGKQTEGVHSHEKAQKRTFTPRFQKTEKEGHRELHGEKNNFVMFQYFSDENCESSIYEAYAYALGQCFTIRNVDDEKSFSYKANTREGTIVQLTWNNHDCRGVPSNVYDLGREFGVSGPDECSSNFWGGFSYFSDYPDVYNAPPGGVARTFTQGEENYEMCYERFDYLEYYEGNVCHWGDWYSLDYCGEYGYNVISRYDSEDCTGDYWNLWEWLGMCYMDWYVPSYEYMPPGFTSVYCFDNAEMR